MKLRFFIAISAFLLAANGLLFAAEGEKKVSSSAVLKIVESVPEETGYGSALTERPQKVWLDMINSAKETLDFEQYYIAEQPGEVLTPVLEAIKTAIGRGVKVRFLVGSNMMRESGKPLAELRKAGAETAVINFGKAFKGGVQHTKFFIADGKEVYVGSQNFDWRSLKHIHEIGVRINSRRAAKDFGIIFEDDWQIAMQDTDDKNLSKEEKSKAKEEAKARALKIIEGIKTSNPITSKKPETALLNGKKVKYSLAFGPIGFINKGFDTELSAMLKIINGAKKTLSGQVMTYHLDEYGSGRWEELDKAFRAAGARGVKVNLVFADWTMGKAKSDADIKSLAKAKNISVKIASLKEHSSGFIPFARVQHSKYLTADGNRSYISTSNWGPTYFTTSRGAGIVIYGAEGSRVLNDVFKKIWNGPFAELVDQDKEYKPVNRKEPSLKTVSDNNAEKKADVKKPQTEKN